MTNLQTDPDLLAALRRSATRSPTKEQLERQRLSSVIGSLPQENDMTREEVREILDRHEGRRAIAG